MGEAVHEHLAWLRLRNLRESTIMQRHYALARLRRALGHDPLTATRDELAAWQRGLRLTPVGMATEITHVASYYRWAHEEGLIPSNPAARLIRPRKPKRVPRPMPPANLTMAIDCAPPAIRLMLILAAFCGLRAGECARLQRADILDARTPPVVLVDGKGGRQRIVPLSTRVLMEIKLYGPPTRGPLFPRLDGRPGGHSPARLSQLVNRYLHDLGIPDTMHAARHWFGTNGYHRTHDLLVIQELMGHSDPATTAGYVAYSNARAVEAVEAVAEEMDATGLDIPISPHPTARQP